VRPAGWNPRFYLAWPNQPHPVTLWAAAPAPQGAALLVTEGRSAPADGQTADRPMLDMLEQATAQKLDQPVTAGYRRSSSADRHVI